MLLIAVPAALFVYYARSLPDITEINDEAKSQTTKLFASDSTPLTDLFTENRVLVSSADLPRNVQNAVVAIEDERFYRHRGVDVLGILRALRADISAGRVAEGGSTITQQYVKNAYFTQERTLERKIKEAILSFELERRLSKQAILAKYLNTIYFGHGAYGVEAASQTFFGKSVAGLTLEEAATLAGVVANPAGYSPRINPAASLKRRNFVLDRMVEVGFLGLEEAEAAKSRPLKLKAGGKFQAPKAQLAPHFVEYVKRLLITEYGEDRLFKGGLRIHTTLNPRLQRLAENAISRHLNREDDPSAALVAMDPKTGAVLAMVGGGDFRKEQFNLAVQGRRQPGSSFKIFVLAAAISEGFSPDRRYSASSPQVIEMPGRDWRVSNYEGKGGGMLSLREAAARSVNTVFAKAIVDVGPEKVVEIAKLMGVASPINPDPAIALGGLRHGVSPLDMATALIPLANEGWSYAPRAITKVTEADGRVLDTPSPERGRALSPTAAAITTDVLRSVVSRGTGRRANIGRPQAGKTGTTQNYADAWYVGYTPDLTAAVWVGYPEAKIPMTRVHGIRVAGGTFPARIWADFARAALSGVPEREFPRPPKTQLSWVSVCTIDGMQDLRPNRFCALHGTRQAFLKGSGPTKFCPLHKAIPLPNVVGKPVDEAQALLAEAGLAPQVTGVPRMGEPLGVVISQSPAAGAGVGLKAPISLTVTVGPPTTPGSTPRGERDDERPDAD